ncbi:MAG: SDR family oxidoreductase [Balneolales bacterium]
MSETSKTIWITGASSGIGEALAYAYSKTGSRIILSSRKKGQLERVQKQCETLGGEAFVEPIDLSELDALKGQAKHILETYGPIDLLINNGGVAQRSTVIATNLEIEQTIMRINFLGHVELTRAVLPDMIQQKKGHIVVVSSVMGKFSTPGSATYSASKHALQGYFDALRAEVDQYGVKVTIVCPGFVKTRISYNALTSDGTPHDKMDRGQQRGISPEACANKIIKAVNRGREEITIGGPEIAAVYIKRWFPWLLSRIVKRIKR